VAVVRQQLAADNDVHAGVHEARKALKRVRAVLNLARPMLDGQRARQERKHFRSIARRLAQARDAHVLAGTIIRLESRFPEASDNAALRSIRREQRERADEQGREIALKVRSQILAELDRAEKGIRDLRLPRDGFTGIEPGLRRTYAEGRRMAKRASRSGNAEHFHDWRKAVQDHWRHMLLLERAWDEEMTARARAVRELSDILGWDHDIEVLVDHLEARAPELDSKAVARCCLLCAQLQNELRAVALPLGARLYAERPRRFTQRMQRYWKASGRLQRARKSQRADSADHPKSEAYLAAAAPVSVVRSAAE
jgi:CHAD domain-containing protein